jgi:hypothetical protein
VQVFFKGMISFSSKIPIATLVRTALTRYGARDTKELQKRVLLISETSEIARVHWKADPEEWESFIMNLPCLESVVRSCRKERAYYKQHGRAKELDEDDELDMPEWYQRYLASEHYRVVKAKAREVHNNPDHCLLSADHLGAVWHHNRYDRIGIDGEWHDMVFLCHECHELISPTCPAVPRESSSFVERWL